MSLPGSADGNESPIKNLLIQMKDSKTTARTEMRVRTNTGAKRAEDSTEKQPGVEAALPGLPQPQAPELEADRKQQTLRAQGRACTDEAAGG